MPDLAQLSEDTRELALSRYRLLQPHLEQDRTLRSVADEAGVSFRTLQRWVAQYHRSGLVGLVRKGREDAATAMFSQEYTFTPVSIHAARAGRDRQPIHAPEFG